MSDVFIAWVGFQRRADVMRDYWGYELIHLKNEFKNKKFRIFDYLVKTIKSIKYINKNNPKNVWIQLPPSIFLYYLAATKKSKKIKIIADFHNSMLRDQWFNLPYIKNILENSVDIIIAHNEDVRSDLLRKGLSGGNIVVLEDKSFYVPRTFSGFNNKYGNYILFPCSFDVDEPISVVIECAKIRQDINFVITGKYIGKLNQSIIDCVPSNVYFTGYVSNDDYNELLCGAFGVLGLTTRNNVQLSVANEAVSAGVPMVLSSTPTLIRLFNIGSVFIDTMDSNSMSNGISELINNREKYQKECLQLLNERDERWLGQAENLRRKLGK